MGFFNRIVNGIGRVAGAVDRVAQPINDMRNIGNTWKYGVYKPIRNAYRAVGRGTDRARMIRGGNEY